MTSLETLALTKADAAEGLKIPDLRLDLLKAPFLKSLTNLSLGLWKKTPDRGEEDEPEYAKPLLSLLRETPNLKKLVLIDGPFVSFNDYSSEGCDFSLLIKNLEELHLDYSSDSQVRSIASGLASIGSHGGWPLLKKVALGAFDKAYGDKKYWVTECKKVLDPVWPDLEIDVRL
jgi:hypothetical protein